MNKEQSQTALDKAYAMLEETQDTIKKYQAELELLAQQEQQLLNVVQLTETNLLALSLVDSKDTDAKQ